MKVIVAEKPSVARDIARVLGCRRRQDGYLTGNGYAVTWAFGHLVRIAEPETINAAWGRPWKKDQLPMVPAPWKYEVTKDGKKQFAVIKKLLIDPQTTEVIAATDAGREGEHIFRLIYQLSGSKKPCRRLWIRSLTDDAIREGFRALKPSADFDALAEAARTRAHADWLMGLNFTRAYTLHNGQLCTVGRVQTPTLALIVHRHAEIERFEPETFYEVHAVLEPGFSARYIDADKKTRIDKKVVADGIVRDIVGVRRAIAISVQTKDTRTNAPALFDLLTLQKEANKRFGYTASDTLAIAQALYENHKLLSYPRTESRHLSRDMLPTLPGILDALAGSYPETVAAAKKGLAGRSLSKAYVDDTKLTDHHALIPTNKTARDLALSEKEQNVYGLVCRRFLAIFLPPWIKAETLALFSIGPHTFKATGSVVKDPGWTIVQPADTGRSDKKDGKDEKAQKLPVLNRGQSCPKRSQSLETRRTKPPRPYNDASLLDAMKKAGANLNDDDLKTYMKHSGLGTAATRAAIIERLLKTAYIERLKKTLAPTAKGIALVDQVHAGLRDPVLTATWEQRLKDIEDGKLTGARFEEDIVSYLEALLPKVSDATPMAKAGSSGIGSCPACRQGVVRETPKAFGCSRWRQGCKFTIWKKLAGKTLTAHQVRQLLAGNKTRKLKGFRSKKGNKFDAALVLDERFRVQFVFQ
jgi:DNA topoisomerase-3